jgi:hypothetical protein
MRPTPGVFVFPLFVALAATAACGDSAGEACGRTEADPATSLAAVQRRIQELGGDEAYPVLPFELFFEGNHDEASIAPNLVPHPGMDTFRCVLREIAERAEVSEVVVQISEVTFEDEWPYADSVLAVTTASAKDVRGWAEPLRPDETGVVTWAAEETPPGAPPVPDGHRVVVLFWD